MGGGGNPLVEVTVNSMGYNSYDFCPNYDPEFSLCTVQQIAAFLPIGRIMLVDSLCDGPCNCSWTMNYSTVNWTVSLLANVEPNQKTAEVLEPGIEDSPDTLEADFYELGTVQGAEGLCDNYSISTNKRQNMGYKLGRYGRQQKVCEAGTEDCRWSKSQVQKAADGCTMFTILQRRRSMKQVQVAADEKCIRYRQLTAYGLWNSNRIQQMVYDPEAIDSKWIWYTIKPQQTAAGL